MTKIKDRMVRLIQQDAAEKMAAFASEMTHAAPEEKEQILAGLEFERWLEETSRECLDRPPDC
jgi:peptidyl-tRNA hydrolase